MARNAKNNEVVGFEKVEANCSFIFFNDLIKKEMLISDGINHGKLQSIIVGELKKAGLKHRLKKIILKNVKVSISFVDTCSSPI